MADIPIIPITGVWARRVADEADPYPAFALGVTLKDGTELALRTCDLHATSNVHISGHGILKALTEQKDAEQA